jgi:membrane-associated protease RseP (regulator of RpoE activity)
MRHSHFLVASFWLSIVAIPFLAGNGLGQSLLNQLEQQLGQEPAAGAAAPGTGYLGAMLDDDRDPGRGVRITSVRPSGPAEASGLKAGDLITAIDGKPIKGMEELDAILIPANAGQKLRFIVDRGGQSQSLQVTLGAKQGAPAAISDQPPATAPPTTPAPPAPALTDPLGGTPAPRPPLGASDPAIPALPATPGVGAADSTPGPPTPLRTRPLEIGPPPLEPPPAGTTDTLPAPGSSTGGSATGGGASLGISVLPLTEEARVTYNLPVRRGALVMNVKPGSPADQAGIPIGGAIVAIDGRRVDSDNELVAAIRGARPGQEVELTYYQGDRLARKNVRLAPPSAAAGPGTAGPASSGIASSPPSIVRPGTLGPALGGQRPLLDRIEGTVDRTTRPPAGGNVAEYNPSEMASLQSRVAELTEQVKTLEERLKAIESKLPGGTAAPGLGSFGVPGTNP